MGVFVQHTEKIALASRRVFLALTVATLFFLVLGLALSGKAHAQEDADPDDFVEGEVVVKLNRVSGTTIENVYSAYPEVDRGKTQTYLASAGIYLLRLQEGSDTARVVEEMRGDTARFVYAEFNYKTDAPEDSRWMKARADSEPAPASQASSYRSQYAVGALGLPQAHQVNRGAGAKVAVLDTGAQLDHPELAGSLVAGYDFIGDDRDPSEAPNGVDDDGDNSQDEATGHGTHVAGIVHLTAPDAKIMPMRVLDSDGRGNIFVIAEALQRAVDPDGNPGTNDGVDVVNMSFSSSRESSLIRDVSADLGADGCDDDDCGGDDDDDGPALRGVPADGVVVVGSAGNDNAEKRSYPAAEEGVIGVASVGEDEKRSDFSNYYGSPEVDISAPGDDIYSLFPANRYAEWDGTSMSAPFVAGQAALIRSMRPGLPPNAPQGQPSVAGFVTGTARPIDAKNPAYSGKLGAGHADVNASTRGANTAPAVSRTRPGDGSRTRDRTPLVSARVSDAQTNLASNNIRFYVGGRRLSTFSYDPRTDLLEKTVQLPRGYHRVKVAARDTQGRATSRTWGFRIAR